MNINILRTKTVFNILIFFLVSNYGQASAHKVAYILKVLGAQSYLMVA